MTLGGGVSTRALPQAHFSGDSCALTTSVIAPTVAEALEEIKEAVAGGADIVELRIDFIDALDASKDVPAMLDACPVPVGARRPPPPPPPPPPTSHHLLPFRQAPSF